jgi:hypothetical protein
MNDFDFSRIDMIVCDAEPIENGTTIKQMYISNKNGELSMHACSDFISPLKFTSSVWLKLKETLTEMLVKENLEDVDSQELFTLNLDSISLVSIDEDEELKIKQQMRIAMDKEFFKNPDQARDFGSIVMTQIMRLMGVEEKAISDIYKK